MSGIGSLERYEVGKRLASGAHSEVFAAVRARDGREVVLKTYQRDATVSGGSRAQAEAELLRRVAGVGITPVVELIQRARGAPPVLVLERVAGLSLGHWATAALPPLGAFLDVAIELAGILARIHAQRFVHHDVTPANVMVDPDTLRVHLVDFGLACPVGGSRRPDERSEGPAAVGGTLAYVSPEQTGRTEAGVDTRSDLYSLGATFHFALTGHAPFEGLDALALVHAHMARVPAPVTELRPELPVALARIVQKLLQKMPEDRYQTAHALQCDLGECRDQLLRRGAIAADLVLGAADAPHRPLFSQRLYGREREVVALLHAYQDAAHGKQQLVVTRGAPGIGKSALVHALRDPLARTSGYLATGKFDLYRRDLPYAGILQALESLTQQILTESDERLAYWRAMLARELGGIARVLTDLVPDLALVIGETAPVPQLDSAATRARLSLAVRRFVWAAARTEHPLVLFLDDLQWADAGSRDLLRELLVRHHERALLVLCAYRDGEVDAQHPLTRVLEELNGTGVPLLSLSLGPLENEDCARMLADALGRSPDQTGTLAACVARKTGNAPLLIQQFVSHMYDLQLIRFSPGQGWTWDEAALAGADIPDDAVGLMTAKIARLDLAVAEVLQLASCVGDRFDLDTLAALTVRSRDAIESALFTLCDEGLLGPARSGFRFVHDRIREAAHALLTGDARARLHLDAARLLLERTPESELDAQIFAIADHLCEARVQLEESFVLSAIEIQLRAGNRALHAGAPATAIPYFAEARALFRTEHFEICPTLGVELHLQSAEAAYQAREHELALAMIAILEQRPLTLLQRAQVQIKKICVYSLVGDIEDTLRITFEALRSFGVRWSANPSRLQMRLSILRTDLELRRRAGPDLFRPAGPGDHSRWLAPLLVMVAAGGSMTIRGMRLIGVSSCFALKQYWRHGYINSPAMAVAAYAACRLALLGHLRGADRLIAVAREWQKRVPSLLYDHRVDHILAGFVEAWTKPRAQVLEPLRRAEATARELGDLQYVHYAMGLRAVYGAASGEPLAASEQTFALLHQQTWLQQPDAPEWYPRALRLLAEPAGTPEYIAAELAAIDAGLLSLRSGGRLGMRSLWVSYLCVLGQYAEVYRIGQDPSLLVHEGPTVSVVGDLMFFCGLATAELAPSLPAAQRRAALRRLREYSRRVSRIAADGPDFVHMASALAAERARLAGKPQRALEQLSAAADRAWRQGYLHHAGLLHERRAALLLALRRSTEAGLALREAIALYEQWGAAGKVQTLREQARSLSWASDR